MNRIKLVVDSIKCVCYENGESAYRNERLMLTGNEPNQAKFFEGKKIAYQELLEHIKRFFPDTVLDNIEA